LGIDLGELFLGGGDDPPGVIKTIALELVVPWSRAST